MQFTNHTPFPALAFAGIDQRGRSFHVVALRQAFTWNDTGQLIFADEQEPLCEADEFFGEGLQGSVRQESDLCPYKPRCDVIVNAIAYAPHGKDGKPRSRFTVRLEVRRPGTPAPLPREPQGLNQFMSASPEEMAAYRKAVDLARRTVLPGESLIDKTLTVTGARHFVRRPGVLRLCTALVKLGTLGMVRPSSWRLTAPRSMQTVPVRLEQAFGGQCRIEVDSLIAEKVPRKYRVTLKQDMARPDAEAGPALHDAFATNPAGRGFVRDWYLKATGLDRVPAPQIEYPEHPVSPAHYIKACAGKLDAELPLVAGLGIRPKGHPHRARLVGTVDGRFIEGPSALPEDFDFGVWNAAWPDQQTDALQGDEAIELTNLCSPDTPAVERDALGNHVLRLALPGHLPFVLVRFVDGSIGELAARLDTVLVDPERNRLSCVWRATVASSPQVRALEARLLMRARVEASDDRVSSSGQQEAFHG